MTNMESERIALITGGGSGVGRACALALAEAGFATVLAGRRVERLEEAAAEIAGRGLRSLAVPADVADPAAVEALFARVSEAYGRLDLLFNNAGIGAPPVPLEDLSLERWRKVVDVNLTGSFLCAQQAIRLMKAQDPRGGRIINNGSISAHVPRPRSVAYTATKHAITGLTRQIALDGREDGITCGQIDIGNALSAMTQRMGEGVLQADGSVRAEPTMDVDAVARAVVYMATLPPDANVLSMTVMASTMPFVGRG
jgi:NAD(P)-dependent dehydrogenase (short-subunit alcohol dehydrogenase family)